jgi:hypothetical protein
MIPGEPYVNFLDPSNARPLFFRVRDLLNPSFFIA